MEKSALSSHVTMIALSLLCIAGCSPSSSTSNSTELFKFNENASTRWASFENSLATKSQAGKTNNGAKGYPFHVVMPDETVTLFDEKGPGIINRIWMTVDRLFGSPEQMRSIRIDMVWDNSDKPAVSAPLADFFCMPLGRMIKFENELFSSPEAKSFVCYIPMPYRTGARITLTNEADIPHRLFYDVNFLKLNKPDNEALYFHAHWRRETPTSLGQDFQILPPVSGKGKFLGSNIGVLTDKRNIGWWGEGEAKIFLDNDGKFPTLCGTGTEDYISTGWGQGFFANRYHGSLLSDNEKGLFGFYRFHIPDPVQFTTGCKVTIQQMGGTAKKNIQKMLDEGLAIQPVSIIKGEGRQYNLLGPDGFDLNDEQFTEDMWTNYYRQDDVCATAYFYLDSPSNNLPALPSLQKRTEALIRP